MVNCSIVKFVCGLIVEVFLVWADGLQQLQDVVWIQSAGLGGHAAGQVWVADVCYSLKSINIVVKKNIKTGFRRGLFCLLIKICWLSRILTLWTYSSPGLVVSMLPPASAARSTTTEPSLIDSTNSFLIRMGARFPEWETGNTEQVRCIKCSEQHAIWETGSVQSTLKLNYSIFGHKGQKNTSTSHQFPAYSTNTHKTTYTEVMCLVLKYLISIQYLEKYW